MLYCDHLSQVRTSIHDASRYASASRHLQILITARFSVTGVLVGALLAVIAAAGALGSGDRQAWEYLRRVERQYAENRKVPWSSLKTVVRSDASADDKLTAILDLLGQIDARVLPKFERTASILSDLQHYFHLRYRSLLFSATYILFLLFASPFLPKELCFPFTSFNIPTDDALLLLILIPLAWLLFVLYKIGKLETDFYAAYDSLEDLS